jgi:hypothetical protein
VALAIWSQAGTFTPGTRVVISLSATAAAFSFHPSQAGRALRALCDARLVTVERLFRSRPLVTILAVPPGHSPSAMHSAPVP